MRKKIAIKCLFLDIGEVLLNDGWDHNARKRAAVKFKLNLDEINDRHHMVFETFEEGKLTLEEYLNLVVFNKKRSFTATEFQKFMFAQSKSYPEMIGLICKLKAKYGLKIVVVSNEERELNLYRIQKFKLAEFVDFFISSCFIHIRKPDADIFRFALDFAQVTVNQVIYIDNTQMFIEIAEGLGIRSVLHTDYKSTCKKLASFGLDLIKKGELL